MNRFVVLIGIRHPDTRKVMQTPALSYERIEDAWKAASRINSRSKHPATIMDRG